MTPLIEVHRCETEHVKKKISPHFHSGYEIVYIEKGHAEFTIGSNSHVYPQNHLIFINDLQRHHMIPTELPYHRTFLILDREAFDHMISEPQLRSLFRSNPNKFGFGITLSMNDHLYVQKIMNSCLEEYLGKEVYWEKKVLSNLTDLFIYLYRHYKEFFPIQNDNQKALTATRLQDYLDSHYLDNLNLHELSRIFHLDKYYLAHTFHDVTGYTIKQYIILKRLSYAKDQLVHSNASITTVAFNAGFNSSSNFIRSFKKHEGVTPLQFRKSFGE